MSFTSSSPSLPSATLARCIPPLGPTGIPISKISSSSSRRPGTLANFRGNCNTLGLFPTSDLPDTLASLSSSSSLHIPIPLPLPPALNASALEKSPLLLLGPSGEGLGVRTGDLILGLLLTGPLMGE